MERAAQARRSSITGSASPGIGEVSAMQLLGELAGRARSGDDGAAMGGAERAALEAIMGQPGDGGSDRSFCIVPPCTMEAGICPGLNMRLRSSQFVLLMLLICSAQVREEYAWHLRDGAASSPRAAALQQRGSLSNSAQQLGRLHLELERLNPPARLSSAAIELQRTAWTMRTPAAGATAIASHTGYRRA